MNFDPDDECETCGMPYWVKSDGCEEHTEWHAEYEALMAWQDDGGVE